MWLSWKLGALRWNSYHCANSRRPANRGVPPQPVTHADMLPVQLRIPWTLKHPHGLTCLFPEIIPSPALSLKEESMHFTRDRNFYVRGIVTNILAKYHSLSTEKPEFLFISYKLKVILQTSNIYYTIQDDSKGKTPNSLTRKSLSWYLLKW